MSEERREYMAGAKSLYMVFDVESVGLHGEGFAVAAVVVDSEGKVLNECLYLAPSRTAKGFNEGRAWIREHVEPFLPPANETQVYHVRQQFWNFWLYWRALGARMAADVCWPVETNFLSECIYEQERRAEEAPYPLLDIASIRYAAGLDPLETCERLPDELPAHNPLKDARQSARLLVEALRVLKGR